MFLSNTCSSKTVCKASFPVSWTACMPTVPLHVMAVIRLSVPLGIHSQLEFRFPGCKGLFGPSALGQAKDGAKQRMTQKSVTKIAVMTQEWIMTRGYIMT